MLEGVSILCFAASYLVALCLEISRLFFRVKLRTAIMVSFVAAGIVAHTIYLAREAQSDLAAGTPLSSWYHGCLMIAWLLAVTMLVTSIRKLTSPIGLTLLPTILALVGVSQIFPKTSQLSGAAWHRMWSLSHGIALLLGTAVVVTGFVAGLMYLAQSYRLKHKMLRTYGLRLPSLERLQRISENTLVASCVLLLIGLISGILLSLVGGDHNTVQWSDPVVWPSALLLLWLLVVLTFNSFYKPARQGQKVAYLTFASFIFLGIVFCILVLIPDSHGKGRADQNAVIPKVLTPLLTFDEEVGHEA